MIFTKPVRRKISVPAGPDPDFVATIEITSSDEVFTWTCPDSGTYSATIDYGDGSPLGMIDAYNSPDLIHTYSNPGQYDVRISGQLGGFAMIAPGLHAVKRIRSLGVDVFDGTMRDAFKSAAGLEYVDDGISTANIEWRGAFSFTNVKGFTLRKLYGSLYDLLRGTGDSTLIVDIEDMSGATSHRNMIYASDLIEFRTQQLTLGGTFQWFCRNAPNITAMPDVDFSGGTSFAAAWLDAELLATFPANAFDTCLATNFGSAFNNCALTQQSVDNILISIDVAGQSSGTLDIAGGTSAAPSAAGLAAKANLEARGWAVTTN